LTLEVGDKGIDESTIILELPGHDTGIPSELVITLITEFGQLSSSNPTGVGGIFSCTGFTDNQFVDRES